MLGKKTEETKIITLKVSNIKFYFKAKYNQQNCSTKNFIWTIKIICKKKKNALKCFLRIFNLLSQIIAANKLQNIHLILVTNCKKKKKKLIIINK